MPRAFFSAGQRGLLCEKCAAFLDLLLESILFEIWKGSFTGTENQKSLFVQVSGETLLLDEINALSLGLHGKILWALEEGRVGPQGGE